MANSKVIIAFSEVPTIGQVISLSESNLNIDLLETFRPIRNAAKRTAIPSFTVVSGQNIYSGFISQNYKTALELDYNSTGLFTITYTTDEPGSGIGTVTIEANYPNAVFSVVQNTTGSGTEITIVNQPAVEPLEVTNLEFTTATGSEASHCTINLETNHLANKIKQPFVNNSNTDNPIVFTALRATTYIFELEDVNGQKSLSFITTPAHLNIGNFSLQINNSPNGATVIVSNVNSDGLELQYSLDGDTWQESNVFYGLAPDDFTLYIKDQLGYQVTMDFRVDEFGIHVPHFKLSKSNSIRFANRITWGDSENYKTDENTLSNEVDVPLPETEIQRFQSADVITTQFESNYTVNEAKIVKCDETEISVPVIKKTNNIGLKDKRDARKYNLGGGNTGVYFLAGNIYDYVTSEVTNTHALNGLLPEWGQIGNYIEIDGAWFLIENIVFDETKNADVIVFSDNYSGAEVSIVAGSIYNRFNYEVYEFTIDMVGYIDQKFRVKFVNEDPHFTNLEHLSEIIWCKVKHDNVLEIKYWNNTNTDIMYSTGIQHKIRIPYLSIKGKPEGESETYKTDTNTILIKADLYEADEIQFQPVTKEIWRKIMIALSHENVLINGVGYVKSGDFNTEGPLNDTNLYVLSANMIKTGSVYNSQTSGNLEFNESDIEVPGLIETDSGYVKY